MQKQGTEAEKEAFLLHPCLKEYLRWIWELPLRYTNPKETPDSISEGFEYLCFKYGKDMGQSQEAPQGFSEEGKSAIMDIVNRMNQAQPGSISKVIL